MKKLFWLLLVPASATSLFAQSPAPVVPDLPRAQTVLDAMFKAGPIMIPLFLLSVISVMLVIVYFMTIRRGAIVSRGFMATADALLRKRDYLGLLAVSNRHGEAIARVVQQVLDFTTKNPNADFEQVREIAETEGTRVASNLNNRVTYLADISQLIGFVLVMVIGFGLVFELPVVLFVLGMMRIITSKWLHKNRPFWFLGLGILANFLTPGVDPLTPLIMFVPLYVFYEGTALLLKIIGR